MISILKAIVSDLIKIRFHSFVKFQKEFELLLQQRYIILFQICCSSCIYSRFDYQKVQI